MPTRRHGEGALKEAGIQVVSHKTYTRTAISHTFTDQTSAAPSSTVDKPIVPTAHTPFLSVKMPSDKLVDNTTSILVNIKRLDDNDPGLEQKAIRQEIVQAARAIINEVSDPVDYLKSEWVNMADMASWNVFMDWKAFDKIPLTGSISLKDLAESVGAEESLIVRIASLLVATGKLTQPKPGHVGHGRFSPLYRSDSKGYPQAWVAGAMGMRPYALWPSYFAEYGRGEPQGRTHTPASFAWGRPELPIWDIIGANPEHKAVFGAAMKAMSFLSNADVVGDKALYSLDWIAEEAAEGPAVAAAGEQPPPPPPLLVDVGGGLGQMLKMVLTAFPSIPPARLVLQDREEVIEEARRIADPVLQGVVHMPHDFHQPQPVQGALVYVLRRVLNDWPDKTVTTILSHLAKALPDDTSARVLIVEPKKISPPKALNAIVDLVMLNIGGKLRDRESLDPLVTAAGMKIVGYYEDEESHAVECAKA
ncbi:hypothetical protein RB601_005326 [Gaeumannomyces tritici]